MESLNSPEAVKVIQAVTEEKLGRPVTVRFIMDDGSAQPVDKLEELIRQGSRFENFTVKP